MKIRNKNRKWILHYHRLGCGAETFGVNSSSGVGDTWPISPQGISGVQAFARLEATGKKEPTRHPQTIQRLTAGKKVHGITVEMWAQDRAEALLPLAELKEYCNEVPGLLEEVERRKVDYWPNPTGQELPTEDE